MKPLAFVLVALALAATSAVAAPSHLKLKPLAAIPDTATAVYASAEKRLTPRGRQQVAQLTSEVASGMLDPSALGTALRMPCKQDLAQCNGTSDVDLLAFVILMEAAKSAGTNISDLINNGPSANIRDRMTLRARILNGSGTTSAAEINASAASIRADLTSRSDLSESQQLELQMEMDNYGKLMEALSNVLKKISDTSASIIQNMK